jgi:phosphoglycolate phosphatase-like HAD superfamily hydrolase
MKALVLDFDGVIADSAPEAFVVALRTHCALEPGSRLCRVLARLDPRRLEADPLFAAFLELMPLGNRAEDYGVALAALEAGVALPDQSRYDAFKAAHDAARLRAFHERFYRVRAEWERADRSGWLALLAPYPAFLDVLRRRAGEVELAIATAKDRHSVRELLAHYGVAPLFSSGRVLDKETGVSKRAHLEHLQRTLGVAFDEITFLEDKVNHLETVAPLGVRCALAAWGYNGPREHARARELGYLVCRLGDAEARLFGERATLPT